MKGLSRSVCSAVFIVLAGCSSAGTSGTDLAQPASVAVGGQVTGLLGSGLVLTDNGGDDLAVASDGSFRFATKLASLTPYNVTVKQQPTMPSQTCVVSATGVYTGSADVTDILVRCTTNQYAVGGSVTGLSGTGLVVQDNGGDDLPIASNGSFKFATPIASGATFTVTVKAQPGSPTQTCAVMGGSGTVGGGDVTSVAINCSTNSYLIGGSVSGLAGSGLVLQNNGGDNLSVSANGSFAFTTPAKSGAAFAVTVATQPSSPQQTCTVTMGSGSVVASNVTTVAVRCTTNTYSVGGNVSGLAGSGLVLQDNLGDNLPISANGAFTFATPVSSGAVYSVTVLAQPTSPWQTCSVTSGSGTITTANVTSVVVSCATNRYNVGGSVSGLAGSGLVLSNGSDQAIISANGAFTFPAQVASGAGYNVAVATQPQNPWQTCSVAGGSGTVGGGDVTSVVVNCTTDQHVVGGNVTGLAGSGLALTLNNGAPLALSANGTYAFAPPLASGTQYTVAIAAQPQSPWQTCALTGATGTVGGSDVTNVNVTCTTNTYKIIANVSGLAGSGLVLQDNGGDDLAVSANGSVTFATPVASGQPYAVTVKTQPQSPWQTCAVASGAGTVGGGDINSVVVTCTTNAYKVGGTVSGLAGTLVLQNNGGDNLTLTTNGSFSFATAVASNSAYAVTVLTQPGSPSQTCTVTNGGGTVTSADVTSVVVSCTTNTYKIGGSASGLAGSGLVLQNNNGDDLPVGANGAFTFATPVASGMPYSVTIKTQPQNPSQTCSVAGGSGVVGGSDVTSVTINCSTNAYSVGGTVTGLGAATGLVLQNNGGDDLPISGDGSFAFKTPVPSNGAYNVTVKTNPTNPWERCTVANGTGTVTNAAVATVQVTCTVNRYNVIVSVSGLAGTLVLQDNGADNLSIGANGSFTFATQVASGARYNVTVLTQPQSPSQTCAVAAPTGVIGGADVTLTVTCTTNTFSIGGTVSGLASNGLVLQDNGGDDLSITTNGAFKFATPIASGNTYNVTVKTQPGAQTCTVANASGTVAAAAVSNIAVSCAANSTYIAGPSLPNAIRGWANAGLQMTALANMTLTSFVFNNQGQADTLQLQDASGTVLQTVAVPAGSASALLVNVSWPLVAGQTYRLISVNGNNGKWASYGGFPTVGGNLRVNGTWGNNSLQTAYWFTFTQLTGT